MDSRAGVDPARVDGLWQRELSRFERDHPRCLALRERARAHMPHGTPMQWMAASFAHPVWPVWAMGASFVCADGIRFLDTNVGDKSTFCGLNPAPVVRAVQKRVAAGGQFMLPTEDSIIVAEELGRRWGLPYWQFTLSASQANTEAMRLARAVTGRDRILMFAGDYAGHVDQFFVPYAAGGRLSFRGLPAGIEREVGVVQFNDVEALERELARRPYACVITEPALTNSGVVLPDAGFHDALRGLVHEHGALLVIDETHTLIAGPGGLVARWDLKPDIVTAGKAIGGGVPLGAYGMTAQLARHFESAGAGHGGVDHGPAGNGVADHAISEDGPELATGGTLFGNALSMAAARAALLEVLTEDAYERTAQLGAHIADGMERLIDDAGLPWKVQRFYARSDVSFCGRLPRNAAEADADEQPELNRLQRLYLANRGVWEAIETAGPTMSVAAEQGDAELYLRAFGEFVGELSAPA